MKDDGAAHGPATPQPRDGDACTTSLALFLASQAAKQWEEDGLGEFTEARIIDHLAIIAERVFDEDGLPIPSLRLETRDNAGPVVFLDIDVDGRRHSLGHRLCDGHHEGFIRSCAMMMRLWVEHELDRMMEPS